MAVQKDEVNIALNESKESLNQKMLNLKESIKICVNGPKQAWIEEAQLDTKTMLELQSFYGHYETEIYRLLDLIHQKQVHEKVSLEELNELHTILDLTHAVISDDYEAKDGETPEEAKKRMMDEFMDLPKNIKGQSSVAIKILGICLALVGAIAFIAFLPMILPPLMPLGWGVALLGAGLGLATYFMGSYITFFGGNRTDLNASVASVTLNTQNAKIYEQSRFKFFDDAKASDPDDRVKAEPQFATAGI